MTTADLPDRCFHTDYTAARAAFLAAAARAGAACEAYRHPSGTGPAGEPLFIDTARLGPADATTVLLCLSGTHGAEGYCGSAAQTGWLLTRAQQPLPAGVAVLLVHAVNPWGMAQGLRVNENGVDLNRNAIDFSQPLPPNPLFEKWLARAPAFGDCSEDALRALQALEDEFSLEHGRFAVQDALSRGQYLEPLAEGFGGTSKQWSLQVLEQIVAGLAPAVRHVAYLDWHSLIEVADDQFVHLCFNEEGDAMFQRCGRWWGADAISREKINAQWAGDTRVGEAHPSRHGLLMWGVQHALAPQADVAGGVVEFCRAPLPGFTKHDELRLSAEAQWLYLCADRQSARARERRARQIDAWCPQRRSWQATALPAALALFERTLAGAAEWAAEGAAVEVGRLRRYDDFSSRAGDQNQWLASASAPQA